MPADCARDVGVQEQEQPGEQRRQPPGRLQGLHLRAGGGRGAGAVAGAGHPRQAVGEQLTDQLYPIIRCCSGSIYMMAGRQ